MNNISALRTANLISGDGGCVYNGKRTLHQKLCKKGLIFEGRDAKTIEVSRDIEQIGIKFISIQKCSLLTPDKVRSLLENKNNNLDQIVEKIVVNNYPLFEKIANEIDDLFLLEFVEKTYYNDTPKKREIIKAGLASFGEYLLNHLVNLGFQFTPLSFKDPQFNKAGGGFKFGKNNIIVLLGDGINKFLVRHETGHMIDHLLCQEQTNDKELTLSCSPELGIYEHFQKLKEVYDLKEPEIKALKNELIKNYIDAFDKELTKKLENKPEEEKEKIIKEHESEWFNINIGVEFCEKIRKLYPPEMRFITGYASTHPGEYFAECIGNYFNDTNNQDYIEQIKNNWSCYPPNRNNFLEFINNMLITRPYSNRETLSQEDPEMFKRLDKFFSNGGRNIEDLK
ncbi:MAG: hypothetical protein HYU63_08865 [Armatimonadetes bacterium]|nr:hypothetical protein [Armatimonadota bacterium]